MIILESTSDKIQVVLDKVVSANQMQCIASYRDTTSTSITPLRNLINTNSTTVVDLVGSPVASTQRVIDYLSIFNADTIANTVTIRYFNGASAFRLMVARISPGEKIEYQEGEGFRVISNGYAEKTATDLDGVTDNADLNLVVLKRAYINNPPAANAYVEAPQLSMPVKAGKRYWFRFSFFYSSSSATNGSRWNIYGTSASVIHHFVRITNGTAVEGTANSYSTYNAGTATVANSTVFGSFATLEGFVQPDFDGVVYPNFGCELAGSSITLLENSTLQYKQVL